MAAVNAARGEARLKIGETEFMLVPSYERYAAIQDATGLGIWQVLQRIEGGHIRDFVAVIRCASGTEMTDAQIGNLIIENDGLTPIRPTLYVYLSRASHGFDRVNKLLAKHEADSEVTASGETKSADVSAV